MSDKASLLDMIGTCKAGRLAHFRVGKSAAIG